ncbi:MAG: fructosamine kinase family protein [Saprospiraceae bacterium]|nr:fructosamine kinase family protein [Saprospiraceae bacterium]
MVEHNFLAALQVKLGLIKKCLPVSGGDISQAYRVISRQGDFFVKYNPKPVALPMFEAERAGLNAIALTHTIKTPAVYAVDKFGHGGFIIMEFIESKSPSDQDLEKLGRRLADLHKIRYIDYGGEKDNFIGNLTQVNRVEKSWPTFYAHFRLGAQLQMAQSKRLLDTHEIPPLSQIEHSIREYIDVSHPSLLHGDLWSGNYLINQDGEPVLIDPACYQGHHQVDIAMTKLFGGFGSKFYHAYDDHMGTRPINQAETDLYQLYYLLVHLNLFGRGYYQSVARILKRYF